MKWFLTLGLVFTLGIGSLHAREMRIKEHAERDQPHMEAATAALEEAKTSKEPIPLLEKAKKELEVAKRDKGGRRPEAVEEVEKAIEVAKSGQDPIDKINHAIALVRAGMDHGR